MVSGLVAYHVSSASFLAKVANKFQNNLVHLLSTGTVQVNIAEQLSAKDISLEGFVKAKPELTTE